MKYFVDFEATQYTEEIISIGCVREDGEMLYSVVAPSNPSKVTPFITNLTGLTKEVIENACSVDEVFKAFADWIERDRVDDSDIDIFYCWGNSDENFLRNTTKHMRSHKAKMAAGYMMANMIDYHKSFSKSAGRKDGIKLLRVVQFLDPEAEQSHNALDDAIMLKQAYEFGHSVDAKVLKNIFSPAQTQKKEFTKASDPEPAVLFADDVNVPVGSICTMRTKKTVNQVFPDVHAAAEWLRENKIKNDTVQYENFNFEVTEKKILNSCKSGSDYFSFKWRMK